MSYICYVLRSLDPKYCNRTYTGITNNSIRRLRQHNGELTGGAHSTKCIRPLTYFFKIINLTKSEALSIERTIHNMKRNKNKKYVGLVGSVLCIGDLICKGKIKSENLVYYKLAT